MVVPTNVSVLTMQCCCGSCFHNCDSLPSSKDQRQHLGISERHEAGLEGTYAVLEQLQVNLCYDSKNKLYFVDVMIHLWIIEFLKAFP